MRLYRIAELQLHCCLLSKLKMILFLTKFFTTLWWRVPTEQRFSLTLSQLHTCIFFKKNSPFAFARLHKLSFLHKNISISSENVSNLQYQFYNSYRLLKRRFISFIFQNGNSINGTEKDMQLCCQLIYEKFSDLILRVYLIVSWLSLY